MPRWPRTSERPITARQRQFLSYAMRHTTSNQRAPTQVEAAEALGISRGALRGHTERLERKGYIEGRWGDNLRVLCDASGVAVRLVWAIDTAGEPAFGAPDGDSDGA